MNAKLVVLGASALAVVGLVTLTRLGRPVPAPKPVAEEARTQRAVSARMPRLPAPRMAASRQAGEAAGGELRATNLLARVFKGEEFKVRSEQVESYLRENGRSAESLLAAFRATQDPKLLREALEKYPNDPRVNYVAYFAAVCNGNLKEDFPPEARRRLLDAFERTAPDNRLAYLLSAQDYFERGLTDRAVEELQTAAGKSNFEDYTAEFMQEAEEAYRAAGYSEAEAKGMGVMWQSLPDLAVLKRLTQNLNQLASLYRQAGDEESARAAVQIGLDFGQRLAGPADGAPTAIHELVGLKIQELILEKMDPAGAYDDSGRTIKDRLADILQRREALVEMGRQEETVLPALSEQDLALFMDRMKLFGEWEAWQWAKERARL